MVYELISHGKLRTIKIGRARRIPESALEQWITQRLDEQEGAADQVSRLPQLR
jgi:predicted DNA-binding transcriptional regulator AlpA